ncbi:hypothetical protein D3C86_2209250 [compost metagenome]
MATRQASRIAVNGWPINSSHSYSVEPGAVNRAPMVFRPTSSSGNRISDRLKPKEGSLLSSNSG